MTEKPEPLRRGTSAEVIARHIRAAIESGTYRHAEQIPSTRALAAEWGTSVATISRAMQALTEEGLIVARDRSSRVVNYPEPSVRPASQQTRPMLLLVGGYAGSGKTELGRVIARRTGWPMLDKDTATRPVTEALLMALGQPPEDRESASYLDKVRPAEYEALRMLAFENLACGNSVVMTAPFIRELSDPAWSKRIADAADGAGADVYAFWIRCDYDSMQTYLRRRGAARDSYKLTHWDEYAAGIRQDFAPSMPHTIINNSLGSRPLSEQVEEALGPWLVR
ncbi:MAG: GntR family transcriptional regulator [Actinomycetota bacterium]|jgi:predicted kinase